MWLICSFERIQNVWIVGSLPVSKIEQAIKFDLETAKAEWMFILIYYSFRQKLFKYQKKQSSNGEKVPYIGTVLKFDRNIVERGNIIDFP